MAFHSREKAPSKLCFLILNFFILNSSCAKKSKNESENPVPSEGSTPQKQDAPQTGVTPEPQPVAKVTPKSDATFEYPAPVFSSLQNSATSLKFVNVVYPIENQGEAATSVRIAFRIPQDFPTPTSGSVCNLAQLSESNLSQVQIDVWDNATHTLQSDARIEMVKMTQTLAGCSSGAEKVCSTVWPEGTQPEADRSAWDSVLYNGTNVPSGNSSDPLVRSLLLEALPHVAADSFFARRSKRFLFKRKGLWKLDIRLTSHGTAHSLSDCLHIPEFTSQAGTCENEE